MTHMDSPDTEEDFKAIKSQIDMVKRGAFKFFRSVLARKTVDPPLSESDATPSLISIGLSVDSGECGQRAGLRDRAGREPSPSSGHQPTINHDVRRDVPILRMQISIKATFVSNNNIETIKFGNFQLGIRIFI